MNGDVTIIGAGILGATLAWKLAQRGVAITLIDAGAPDEQASVGSLAWLNVSSTADIHYAKLRHASMRLWHEVSKNHPDCPVTFPGTFLWGGDAAQCAAQAALISKIGWPAETWSSANIAAQLPGLAERPDAALFAPLEGVADPARISAWMLDQARRCGATIQTGFVSKIEVSDNRASAVGLSDGRRMEAKNIVIAAGTGSSDLLGTLGIDLSLDKSPGVLMRTSPAPRVIPHVMATPELDFWQDAEGHILMSSSLAKTSVQADDLVAEAATAVLTRLFPELRGITVSGCVYRDRPIPADGFPIVGQIGPPGLYTATTHSGMTLAPVIATALADEIAGRPEQNDLSRYRPDRDMRMQQERAAV